MNRQPFCTIQVVALFVLAAGLPARGDGPAPVPLPVAELKRDTPISFEKEILPVLSANCLACHNRTKAKADLVLETPTDMLKGGENGPAVVPKKADASLIMKVAAHRQDPVMPPKGNKVAASDLTPQQLALVRLWIDQGATGSIGGASTPTVQLQPLPAGLHAIYAAAVTPDGQYAACSRGNEIHVYHLPTGRLVSRLTGHRDLVQSLAISRDGNLLASGAYREVKLWRRPRDVKLFSVTSAARGPVNALDVSPDGATFATGGADGVVRLWGMKDGRPVKEFTGHAGAVTAVHFSPDGAKVASASADKSVRVWNVADGAVFAQTPVVAEPAALAWIAEGKQIAAVGGDALIRVWDVPETSGAAFAAPKELKGHEGAVTALSAVPGNPTQLVSGGADGTLRRWDVGTGQVVKQMAHAAPVTSVTVRPDGKRFASAGGNSIKLWDAEGKQVAEMKGDRYANEAAANREADLKFATSEVAYHKGYAEAQEKRNAEQVEAVKKAAVADVEADKAAAEKEKAKADKQKALEEKQKALAEKKKALEDKTKAKDEKQKAKAPEAELRQADADAKQAEAAVKPAEEEVKKADAEQKKAAEELAKAESSRTAAGDELRRTIRTSQVAADAAAQAAESFHDSEREQKQVEAELAALKAAATAAEKPVRTVAFSSDNLTLASGGDDQIVHTYSAENGAAFETYRGHGGPVLAVAFGTATGSSVGPLVSSGADGAGIAWAPAADWTPQAQLGTGDANSPFADRVTALDFSSDGKLLATGGGVASREGEAMLWEVETGALVRKFERLHSDTVLALEISADGKFLATAAADRFMKLSEISTGRLVKSFEGHSGHVLGVALARTGRTAATASADNTVKVWDLVAGEQKKTVSGFEKEVTSVRFLGDTDQFLATAGDGKVRLLRPDGGEVRSFPGNSGFVYASAASRDGSVVVAGGEDGTLRVWNAADGKPTATLAPRDAAPTK